MGGWVVLERRARVVIRRVCVAPSHPPNPRTATLTDLFSTFRPHPAHPSTTPDGNPCQMQGRQTTYPVPSCQMDDAMTDEKGAKGDRSKGEGVLVVF